VTILIIMIVMMIGVLRRAPLRPIVISAVLMCFALAHANPAYAAASPWDAFTNAAARSSSTGTPTGGQLLPAGTAESVMIRLFPKVDPYLDDPVAWIRDKLGEKPLSYQCDILLSLVNNNRTAVHACHGPGKSYIASRAIAWWIDTRPPHNTRVRWTAPSFAQVDEVIGGELRDLYQRHPHLGQRIDGDCNVFKDGVKVGGGRKPADHNPHGIQGTHRRYVLAIGDEACGLVENITNGLKAITTGPDCRELLIGNPDDPAMPFERACRPGSGYHVIRINALQVPTFTKEACAPYPDVIALMDELGIGYSTEWVDPRIVPSLVGPKWVHDALRDWGRSGSVFTAKVLGLFPEVSKDTLIPPALIRRAYDTDLAGMKPGQFGTDVARYGNDYSVVYRNRGGQIRHVFICGQQSTDTTTGELRVILDEHPEIPMVVDSIGVGGPVFDFLLADGYPMVAFGDKGTLQDGTRFVDARSELYFTAREMFQRGLIDLDENDHHADALANELQEHRFFHTRDGRIRVESKDELKKRLGHSPDFADAFVYSLVDTNADMSLFERYAQDAPASVSSEFIDRIM
jgi:hypothetical protein